MNTPLELAGKGTARIRTALPTLVVALLAGIAGVAGSYAVAGRTPGFIAAPIASTLVQTMPAVVVRYAILYLGALGDRLNFFTAIALAVALLAGTALVSLAVSRRLEANRRQSSLLAVTLTALFGWLAAFVTTGAFVPAVGAGGASAVVVAIAEFASTVRSPDGNFDTGRREVLGGLVSALGVGIVGYLLGNSRGRTEPRSLERLESGDSSDGNTGRGSGQADTRPDSSEDGANENRDGDDGASLSRQQLLAIASERSLDIEGLEGLISGESFYEVDIYNVNPVVETDGWTLSVTGAVERELEFTYDDIISMASENVFKTLRCVGESLNGHKMDNALWTGVPIMDIIERANPQGKYVVLRDGDNYFEEFPVAALQTGYLAYGKDGAVLPRGHGFPVRALVPGHWGEINVKWLTEIEIKTQEVKGFWEKRGWHGTGPVNTVAKLHVVTHLDNGELQVAGNAYAGTRGISLVEVSTDGGETWDEATLSEPLPASPTERARGFDHAADAWRQWAYSFPPTKSQHEVVVRATDGTGTLQPRERANAFPSGPTGWVSRTVNTMADG